MNREELKSIFDALRNDPQHHLGLGDIRLTIAQQDAILDLFHFKDKVLPPEEGAENVTEDMYEKAEAFLQSKDIWYRPYVSGRENKTGHDVTFLIAEFATQQQPTAEGAEEIPARLNELLGNPDKSIHANSYQIKPIIVDGKAEWWIVHHGIGLGEPLAQWHNKFATLHAQRIAEKMVAERLREELIKYETYFGDPDEAEDVVYEYLKSREK